MRRCAGLERYRCACPCNGQRSGACDRRRSVAPAFAGIAAGPALPEIEQPLARCVEVEGAQHAAAFGRARRMVTADQLVVRHAAVRQCDSDCSHTATRPASWFAEPAGIDGRAGAGCPCGRHGSRGRSSRWRWHAAAGRCRCRWPEAPRCAHGSTGAMADATGNDGVPELAFGAIVGQWQPGIGQRTHDDPSH